MRLTVTVLAIVFASILSSTVSAQQVPDSAVQRHNSRSFLDRTHVGAVGEVSYIRSRSDIPRLDIPRFEITIDHSFSNKWSLISETEIEHVKLTTGSGGEVAVEKLMLDYHASSCIGLRLGLLELPIGTLNQSHDPSSFLSVSRPQFDSRVIPTTWREIGTGIYGAPSSDWSYQLYISEGIRASGFSLGSLEEIKQEGASTNGSNAGSDASHPGLSAKVEWSGIQGIEIGISDYFQSNAGSPNSTSSVGQRFNMVMFNGRYEGGAFHLMSEAGFVSVSNSDYNPQRDSTGAIILNGTGVPLLKNAFGGYLEAGYDVLSHSDSSESSLYVFARGEYFILKSGLYPTYSILGLSSDVENRFSFVTAGLAFEPIANVILKADFQVDAEHDGKSNQFELGAGFSF